MAYTYNSEKLGKDGPFVQTSYKEILLTRYFWQALQRLNPWLTSAQIDGAQEKGGPPVLRLSHADQRGEVHPHPEQQLCHNQAFNGKTEEKRLRVIGFQHPSDNSLPSHQGAENPRRPLSPPDGYRGLCQRSSPCCLWI